MVGAATLVAIDVETGTSLPPTRPARFVVGMPSVAPDGRSVVFARKRNEGQAYDIASPNADQPIRLTDYAPNGQHPVWSPVGRWSDCSAQIPARSLAFGLAIALLPQVVR